ncbi:toll-like receptor Tollo [Bactrocera neohumeralis]|uniref:toll-like receptor Tollo n=1 Tax=Bactrocera neohumeralis TaxID=98809 RepID=UPI0021659FB8|nr:toll-like receptor Tollo [Bactrocera neohumeralis]
MRQSELVLVILVVISYFHILRAIEFDEESVPALTAEDCASITTLGNCDCVRDVNNSTEIICASSSVNISVSNVNGVELKCGDDFHVNKISNVPHLGTLRETTSTTTYNCMHISDLLVQLALTPRSTLNVHGLKMKQLTLEIFQSDFSRLRRVTTLELRADTNPPSVNELSLPRQELAGDILTPMPDLFALTIDLNFMQLPTDLFKPVPNINDITLIGELLTFPSDAFQYLRRLRQLSLRGHYFEHRLRENIFQNLTMIRGLYMRNCSITALPEHIFAPLKMLRNLNLMSNQLSELPSKLLAQQKGLQTLNLGENRIQFIPLGFFDATTKLVKLTLSHNRLRHLAADVLPPLTSLIELEVDSNELRTIASHTFAQPNRLIKLDLTNNQLDWAADEDCAIFEGLQRLQRLLLRNNSLHYLCDRLGSSNHSTNALSDLDVRQNQLKLIGAQLIDTLNTSESFTAVHLSENPWDCNCSAQPLLSFVKNNRRRLGDAADMRCENPQLARLLDLSFRDFCLPEMGVRTVLVVILVCVIALGLTLTTTALCYYKYRIELKIWLYAHRLCLCCVSERDVDRDRKWDAFISYSHHDEEFVEKELVPGLEQGTPPFKVCIHVRDWLAGAYIPEQIIDSVEQSRRTIIVLSQHFIESDWAQMEFRTAHQCAVNEGRSRIILVVHGEIKETELLDPDLKAYLKMNTYLKWGDPWFWRKLRYAMPHARRGELQVNSNAEELEKI